MTSSNGNIFLVTGHLCGEFTGPRWIPAQRPVTRSFEVFFHLHPNKRLSKQSWGWWVQTLSRPLWRQCNGILWDVITYLVLGPKSSYIHIYIYYATLTIHHVTWRQEIYYEWSHFELPRDRQKPSLDHALGYGGYFKWWMGETVSLQ